MKHLKLTTIVKPAARADAFTDFKNAIGRAFADFRVAKKNTFV